MNIYDYNKDVAVKARQEGKMEIFYINLLGQYKTIYVIKTTTIEEVKEMIEKKEGVKRCQQRLIFAGKQLEDDKTIEYYNIQRESTIHMVVNLRGC
jgi:hypothetical protein